MQDTFQTTAPTSDAIPYYFGVLLETMKVSVLVTLASLVVGYPVAFFMVRFAGRWNAVIVFFVIAPLLARELGMRRVMVPRRPGVVSALGGLIAAVKNDFVCTLLLEVTASMGPALADAAAGLRQEAETWLHDEQGFQGAATVTYLADMRYAGQSFEIEVAIEQRWAEDGDMAAVASAFHRQHVAIYDFADETADVQLVNLRLVIAGETRPPDFPEQARVTGAAKPERDVEVWQDGGLHSVPLYLRENLRHGHRFSGPAIKETEDFTTQITDAAGVTVAVPIDLGATWFPGITYGGAMAMIDDYEPGGICFTNDPYSGYLATHVPDIHMWKPVFAEGRIIGFACGHIHNTDMGGAVPASLSRALTEVHQEGIRFPPMKLFRRGVINDELRRVMMLNVRKPDQNAGDLRAFVGALNTGERKLLEMAAKFGAAPVQAGMARLLDYAEHQAREVLTSDQGRVDEAATTAERAGRSRDGAAPHFAFGPEREAHETVWTEAVYAELTTILAAMPVHWRFFVKSKLFELLPRAASLPDAMTALRHAYPEVPG